MLIILETAHFFSSDLGLNRKSLFSTALQGGSAVAALHLGSVRMHMIEEPPDPVQSAEMIQCLSVLHQSLYSSPFPQSKLVKIDNRHRTRAIRKQLPETI